MLSLFRLAATFECDCEEESLSNYLNEINKAFDRDCLTLLPIELQFHIVQLLDPKSIINLAIGIPKLFNICMHQQFWRNIYLVLNSSIITEQNVESVLAYLNSYMQSLSIDFSTYENLHERHIFRLVPNIKHLLLKFSFPPTSVIIDEICDNLRCLVSIAIEWDNLSDLHIINLANAFPELSDIQFVTKQYIDQGLLYLVKMLNEIKKIQLIIPSVSPEILIELFKNHSQVLKKFSLIIEGEFFNSDVLLEMYQLSKLESLFLGNMDLSWDVLDTISSIDSIKSLVFTFKINDMLEDICAVLFTEMNNNIQFLYLDNADVTNEGLIAIAKNCINLKHLVIIYCGADEEGFRIAFPLLKVEKLQIEIDSFYSQFVFFDFFRHKPKEILSELIDLDVKLSKKKRAHRVIQNFEFFNYARKEVFITLSIDDKFYEIDASNENLFSKPGNSYLKRMTNFMLDMKENLLSILKFIFLIKD